MTRLCLIAFCTATLSAWSIGETIMDNNNGGDRTMIDHSAFIGKTIGWSNTS